VLPVDWPAFRAGRGGTLPRLFDTVAPPATAAAPAALPPAADDSPPAIVAALAAEVLGLPALPDTSAPLGGYGLDSLMAITLRNRLRERLGVDLPLARIVGGASAADLAAAVVAALDPGAVLPDVAAMSDAEVEAALRRLAQQEGVE
jgi:acyl carrier protein